MWACARTAASSAHTPCTSKRRSHVLLVATTSRQVFAQVFARADLLSCGDRYYHYTGDPHGYLTQYFERIQGRTQMLMQRRAQALQLKPSDPAYGMLRGDGNEDLGSTEIGCGTAHPDGDMGDCQTELPCEFCARLAAVLCPSCPTWVLTDFHWP